MVDFIANEIKYLLDTNAITHLIVTGLDRSGKSTFISTLYNKYNVYKSSGHDFVDLNKLSKYYKIFDRHPYIESYVYRGEFFHQNKIRTDEDYELLKQHNLNQIKKIFNNAAFLFVLDPKYRNMRDDEFVLDSYDKELTRRYKIMANEIYSVTDNSIVYVIEPSNLLRLNHIQESLIGD